MQVKLLSGALGAEIRWSKSYKIPLIKNFEAINNLLLEHKVIFFRNQNISSRGTVSISFSRFGPLEQSCLCKRTRKIS